MPSTVLVITNDHDEHADAVIEELDRRAVPVFRFHPEEFPDACRISMEIRGGCIDGEIRNAHRRVALHEVRAAWYRRSRALFAPLPSLNLLQGDLENFVKGQSTRPSPRSSPACRHSGSGSPSNCAGPTSRSCSSRRPATPGW